MSWDVCNLSYNLKSLTVCCPHRQCPRLHRYCGSHRGQLYSMRLLWVLLRAGLAAAVLGYDHFHWHRLHLCLHHAQIPNSGMAAFPRYHVRWHGPVSDIPCLPWPVTLRCRTDDAANRLRLGLASGILVHPGSRDLRCSSSRTPDAGPIRYPGELAPDFSRASGVRCFGSSDRSSECLRLQA